MSKLLRKPAQRQQVHLPAKFQKFKLTDNPFPSEPTVNKDSEDRRINGAIYEVDIRRKEYEQLKTVFLKQPQSDPNHLRLGYIMDTSYIGRGNGKSAFLVNLQQNINKEYCLDISEELNKCFAIYVTPELSGRTKTFSSFVEVFFQAILRSRIIETCLASLRLEAISELYPQFNLETEDEELLITNLNSRQWFQQHNLEVLKITNFIYKNEYLQAIPYDFPLFNERNTLTSSFVSQLDFEQYYLNLKRGKERLDFVFSHLVRFFQAASFNGAYILVDDFERIPDFQSPRQKKDFALELRSCLFDGLYVNAKVGFYNFFLVLHAGVPRLMSEAWAESGMENRAPLSQKTASKHIIPFEKLSREHASLLLKKYLSEYRMNDMISNTLFPFQEEAVSKMGELSEYNAAKILKMAYDLLDKAAELEGQTIIDGQFVNDQTELQTDVNLRSFSTLDKADSIDLLKKAGNLE